MAIRLKWFKCKECGHEYEDIVDLDSITSDNCEKCNCSDVPLLDDFRKQIHNDGGKYRHVSWSLWQAGN